MTNTMARDTEMLKTTATAVFVFGSEMTNLELILAPMVRQFNMSNQQEVFVLDASSTQLRPRPLDVPDGRVVARSRVFRYWHSSLWQVACTFSRCSVLSLCSPFVVFSQAVSWPPLSLFLFFQKEQHSLSHNFPQLGLCVCRAFAPKSRHFCSFLALPEQTKVFLKIRPL